MTKNEERKVLAQIKKLIESTGEDSYISTAFQGCIDHADEHRKQKRRFILLSDGTVIPQ